MTKLWSIDGNSQKLDGGAMFGNVPRALWSRWYAADEAHRIDLACRALLADDLNGKTVLFETGIGSFFEPKLKERFGVVEDEHVLLTSLDEAGFDHADIDVVVLSHMHFDHVGGLLSAWQPGTEPELLFPNAQYVVSEAAWARAMNPHPRDRASFVPHLNALLQASGRLALVDGTQWAGLGDAVRFEYSEGHTPGLMLAEIVGEGGQGGMVFCADLIPGRAWVHLPVTMGYDRFPEQIIDEKSAFLQDKIERGVRLFFTHDPACAVATLAKDERGRFTTEHEQTALTAQPF